MVATEDIWYKGIRFRRYPESKHRSFRVYYRPSTADVRRGIKYLHAEVWQDTNNAVVPPGHHVHHVDFNPLNNAPENLVCLTHAEHMAAHATGHATEAQRVHLDRVRPLTAAWHRSEEGRAWHREHARTIAEAATPKPATCTRCGTEYMSKLPRLFCSNKCKAAARRDSGVDDEQRTCAKCGVVFTVNRYRKNTTCSRRCGSGRTKGARMASQPERV